MPLVTRFAPTHSGLTTGICMRLAISASSSTDRIDTCRAFFTSVPRLNCFSIRLSDFRLSPPWQSFSTPENNSFSSGTSCVSRPDARSGLLSNVSVLPEKLSLVRRSGKGVTPVWAMLSSSPIMTENDSEFILDLSDLLCPLPVLKARKRLEAMQSGHVLKVIATDPMSAIDMPHFCSEQGHTLLERSQERNAFIFRIRRK
jgi:tRNA 2-thiouridine synthesizing protein A